MPRNLALVAAFAAVSLCAQEHVDLKVLSNIKAEAFENSQAMDHLFYLTDVYGPRLTNSPGHRAAADWVAKRLESYGVQNVRLEKWGSFGQSWRLKHFSAHLIDPQYAPLIGFPLAWTPGTQGVVSGEPVLVSLHSEADWAKYKGKLKGKVVLTMEPKAIAMITQPLAKRLTSEELLARATVADPARMGPAGPAAAVAASPAVDRQAAAKFKTADYRFLKDEGVLVVLEYGYNGDGGTVFASAAGSRDPKDPVPPPVVALTPEHYNRIARLAERKIPTKLEFDIQTEFLKTDTDSFNVVGEIPGGSKKEEIVMLGAHLDSWHGGTGATDNATGSSVAIEAMRILTQLHLKLDRTVRIALWSGEEEGLLGSKAYVQNHFAGQRHDGTKARIRQAGRLLQR